MGKMPRAIKKLKATIDSIEDIAALSSAPLTAQRKAERMLGKVREIVRSIERMDVDDFRARKKFWSKERQVVTLTVKIVRLLSAS